MSCPATPSPPLTEVLELMTSLDRIKTVSSFFLNAKRNENMRDELTTDLFNIY